MLGEKQNQKKVQKTKSKTNKQRLVQRTVWSIFQRFVEDVQRPAGFTVRPVDGKGGGEYCVAGTRGSLSGERSASGRNHSRLILASRLLSNLGLINEKQKKNKLNRKEKKKLEAEILKIQHERKLAFSFSTQWAKSTKHLYSPPTPTPQTHKEGICNN